MAACCLQGELTVQSGRKQVKIENMLPVGAFADALSAQNKGLHFRGPGDPSSYR